MISQRGFAALVVVTILAGVAAWAVSGSGPTDDVGTGQSVRMLPRLFEGLNDVRSLTVVGPEERFTVERVDDGWVMQEKGGHPVRYESVKGTLMALAELRRMEPKTSNPELYSRLGVEDPTAPEAASTRITAVGEDGTTLCDLIAGNAASPRGTCYVRESGQGRAWHVRGQLSVDPRAVGWLETSIVELPAARVRSVTLRHADGEVVQVAKQAADDVTWELADVPEGREALSPTIGSTLAGALDRFEFDDVSSDTEQTLPEDERVEAVLETFDGLRITVLSAPEGEELTWATLAVEILPDANEEVRAEGEALLARVQGWTYSLSAYRAGNVRKRMDELTRELPPPEPEEEAIPPEEASVAEQPLPPEAETPDVVGDDAVEEPAPGDAPRR
ncbi:MAG: DUF4340 domain-containing protein [Planctomycetota bacterium]